MGQAHDELVVFAAPLAEGTAPTPIEELPIVKENLEFHKKHLPHIVSVMQRRAREVYSKQRELTIQYKRLQESWVRKVRELDEAKPVGKGKKRAAPRGVFVCFYPLFNQTNAFFSDLPYVLHQLLPLLPSLQQQLPLLQEHLVTTEGLF